MYSIQGTNLVTALEVLVLEALTERSESTILTICDQSNIVLIHRSKFDNCKEAMGDTESLSGAFR